MTVPPDEGTQGAQGSSSPEGKDAPPSDFDPYRFGKPDYPIPPEYAPPGYRPPAPGEPKPAWPPVDLDKRPPAPYTPPPYPYGGYTPHPPPPPGYPAYGAVREGNGKATTAMVLGILGILFFWLTILDLGLAIPAIVLGALALRDARRFPARGGRGKALAGLICGIVSLVLVIATVAVVYVRIKPCLQYGISSDRYTSCINHKL